MAVKTLNVIFRIFLNINDLKLIFVNCKAVSVMTGPLSFLLQPKHFGLVVLSTKYWFNDLDATGFHKFFFNNWICFFFVILVPFEISSHYPKLKVLNDSRKKFN